MQVATSRLDIVNETDAFTQKVQHQADHLRQLKKRAIRPRRVRACPDCPEDWSIPPYSGS